mmetsp:Transcript_15836/g.22550  ORF Transcript_15836/g.22550 Transcript_15836/m.22550 type:complete len:203 (-) Transcript_15836:252-860(-)|eukprot:CAMPEP_0184858120 /NCGR_PEP_ID=MMETSP0580-20130426/3236_1 /TAXON_ID=1118495 /ORGANISM="Dactyliosolen fragilissimus" /LENGTH=202 /DNA_ID=CAMNT_0027354085 /DNA_START=48 /DNA_END=656 /DNA_ORIENTATION=+
MNSDDIHYPNLETCKIILASKSKSNHEMPSISTDKSQCLKLIHSPLPELYDFHIERKVLSDEKNETSDTKSLELMSSLRSSISKSSTMNTNIYSSITTNGVSTNNQNYSHLSPLENTSLSGNHKNSQPPAYDSSHNSNIETSTTNNTVKDANLLSNYDAEEREKIETMMSVTNAPIGICVEILSKNPDVNTAIDTYFQEHFS